MKLSDYIPREHHLEILRGFRDRPVIKVITGMRRCGKSTMMEMFRDEIVASGVSEGDTLLLKLGDGFDSDVFDHRQLIDAVREHSSRLGGIHLLGRGPGRGRMGMRG